MSFADADPNPELLLEAAARSQRTAAGGPVVSAMLASLSKVADAAVGKSTKIEDRSTFPAVDDLYSEKPLWLRMEKCVVLSCDLKNSTRLTFKKYIPTGAKVYEASTGPMVRMLRAFTPGFVAIQGDGVFAIYHGEKATERALCAAITVKTYSRRILVPKLQALLGDEAPETGIKSGICRGTLIARKLGMRGDREPVWAGRPVNYAFKCAAHAEANGLVVTQEVYDTVKNNDYITHSCGHYDHGTKWSQSSISSTIWTPTEVAKLGDHSPCMTLDTQWCEHCGDEFCSSILAGKTKREHVGKP